MHPVVGPICASESNMPLKGVHFFYGCDMLKLALQRTRMQMGPAAACMTMSPDAVRGLCAAVPCTEWSARESLAAEAGAMNDIDLRQRAEDMPLGVSLRIMSAPASFALPMVQRKPFKPAFQVCPTLGSLHPMAECTADLMIEDHRALALEQDMLVDCDRTPGLLRRWANKNWTSTKGVPLRTGLMQIHTQAKPLAQCLHIAEGSAC